MKKMLLLIMLVMGLLVGFSSLTSSCRRPLPWQHGHCRAMEEAILAETVRLAIHGQIEVEMGYDVQQINGSISHATVVGGRYLITHNHFGIPLSQALLYGRRANGGFTGVSVYRLDGTAVLDHGPISSFTVVAERGETTVLDFGDGFFSRAGVDSAPTAGGDGLPVATGNEVALIDWDGQGHTRVVWAEVTAVYPAGDLTLMQVDHFIQIGASGGGVFVDGVHVGNNWGLIVRPAAGGAAGPVQRTLVALNAQAAGGTDRLNQPLIKLVGR